jgi:hypothetical protein
VLRRPQHIHNRNIAVHRADNADAQPDRLRQRRGSDRPLRRIRKPNNRAALQKREQALLDRRVQRESLQVEQQLVEDLMPSQRLIRRRNRLKRRRASVRRRDRIHRVARLRGRDVRIRHRKAPVPADPHPRPDRSFRTSAIE